LSKGVVAVDANTAEFQDLVLVELTQEAYREKIWAYDIEDAERNLEELAR
jgi:hypothetical protein